MSRKRPYQQVLLFLCAVVLLMGFVVISNTSQTPIHAQSFRFLGAVAEFNRNYSEYLERLGFNDYKEVDVSDGLPEFTIITGFSSNHVAEGRYMIVNASKTLPGKTIVVYGMHLLPTEKLWFKNACNVEYRDFNLSNYPKHVQKPANYRFKPLIIAEAIKEFGSIMWADTSTLWSGKSISEFLEEFGLKNGPEEPQVYLLSSTGHTTFAATHKEMYRFLPGYSNYTLHGRVMSQAGMSLFFRTKATMEKALKWFVLCALEEECMAPRESQLKCDFQKLYNGTYADCHRYDQSAINLILSPYNNSHPPKETKHRFCSTARGLKMNDTAVVYC